MNSKQNYQEPSRCSSFSTDFGSFLRRMHWDGNVYGTPGNFYVYISNGNGACGDPTDRQTISDEQAALLGVDVEKLVREQSPLKEHEEASISGLYMKKVFAEDSGFKIFRFKVSDENKRLSSCADGENMITVKGNVCFDQEYLPLKISGRLEETAYGVEFVMDDFSLSIFSNAEEAEKFLTHLPQKIVKKQAKDILAITGLDIFKAVDDSEIIENLKLAGIEEADWLCEEIQSFPEALEAWSILSYHSMSYPDFMKILEAYPHSILQMVQEKPYEIPKKTGVNFNKVDAIALTEGFDPLCDVRINAIILWCVNFERNKGNTYFTFSSLAKRAIQTFGEIPRVTILAHMKMHPYIVEDERYDIWYHKDDLKNEKEAAHNFVRLMDTRKELPWHPEYIEQIEKGQGYEFSSEQKEAFRLLKTTGFKLLTGDPGTGKTSILEGLLKYLEMLWDEEYGKEPEFALCAPAGRAAQRMKETTGRPALTIHKLIEYQPYGDSIYCRDASNPLTADVVVVDEASMMGLDIFNRLITAIKNGALVLLIGDTNQLQSVDAGNVLHDIIQCGYVDRCHLTQPFRQAAGSKICLNAQKIIHGDPYLENGADFEIVECDPNETENILKNKVRDLMQTVPKDSIQVLAPMRAGSCGVSKGNMILQEMMNPGKGGLKYGSRTFRVGDRVIMNANNYALSYFNGDIGYITEIDEDAACIQIGDQNIFLPKKQFSDMDLAYSLTIHKAQGTEFDFVIIVLQREALGMMNRNLLYTAVTRGKKKTIILEESVLKKAIETENSGLRRNSFLTERIWIEFEES